MPDESMPRSVFLKKAGTTFLLLTASGTVLSTLHCGTHMARDLRFKNLDDALLEIDRVSVSAKVETNGPWNSSQVFAHLAQSIEYSMTGYPENKPAIFRKTIGRIVLAKFLGQGYMQHNLSDAIPGAPALDANLPFADAVARLKKAISDFRAFQDHLAMHFVYDEATKDQYERVHAYHIANHLSAFTIG